MSMSDIQTEIRFGATVAVDKEQIKQSKTNILAHRKEEVAQTLGPKIAKAKGWNMRPEGNTVICEMSLYVFTPNELRLFLDAKMKQKLIDMSQREAEKDISDRLVLLSERV